MKTLQEKKEIVENFEGFYADRGAILYEDPVRKPVLRAGAFRFQKPEFISSDYNVIMGRCVQTLSKDVFRNLICAGASNPISNALFNDSPKLYVLKWNNKIDTYEGKLADMDDTTQSTFDYDGSSIIQTSGFELNSDENKDKVAGLVNQGKLYKTVPNNPTNQDIENFLFNPENCEAIGYIFIDIQKFLIELLNLYQQGKIIQEIPPQWFSTAKSCRDQALVLLDNLLKFYVNVNPNYYQTYFKQNIDIDNILKLYN
jgi:hypothetical protein